MSIELTTTQKLQLVALLVACPSFADAGSRSQLTMQLSPQIKHSIKLGATNSPTTETLAIVDTSLNFENGLAELITLVKLLDGTTLQFGKVATFLTQTGLDRLLNPASVPLPHNTTTIPNRLVSAAPAPSGVISQNKGNSNLDTKAHTLSTQERNRLTDIILQIDELGEPPTARTFLRTIGLPNRVVASWTLPANNPAVLAGALIQKLEDCGTLSEPPYQRALGAFLEQILIQITDRTDTLYLEELLTAKRLLAVSSPVIWESLEAIQQPNLAFRDVEFLYKGAKSTRAVCRVEDSFGDGLGTGFLVSPNRVLTNHHVLELGQGATEKEKASSLIFHFGYLKENGQLKQGRRVRATHSGKVVLAWSAREQLDYALIELEAKLDEIRFGVLPLDTRTLAPGETLMLLQHPKGDEMKFMEGKLLEVNTAGSLKPRLHHNVNTLGGSSGSPVFDLAWNVVGLHASGREQVANYAVPMSSIFSEIGDYL